MPALTFCVVCGEPRAYYAGREPGLGAMYECRTGCGARFAVPYVRLPGEAGEKEVRAR